MSADACRELEEVLYGSREILSSVWESAADGLRLTDGCGTVTRVNEAYCRITGFAREALEGKPFWEAYPESAWADCQSNYCRRFRAGLLDWVAERRVDLCNGRRLWVEVTSSYVHTSTDLLLLTIYRDVTERKQAEERLRTSQRQYLELYENIPDPVIIFDKSSHYFLAWNSSALRTYGYSRDQVLGMTPLDLHLPEERQRVAATLGEAEGVLKSYTHLARDGRRLQVEILSSEIVFEGRPAILSIMRDLTERLLTEDRLRERDRELRTFLANLPGLAYRCRNDEQWTMLFISEGCQDLTGYSPPELLSEGGVRYADLIHPDDRARVWHAVQEALKKRSPFRSEYRIRHADGRERWALEQGLGVWSDDGELLFLEGLVVDISEQKRIEGQLQRARLESEAASRAKSAFLANMSHEIRTPMNGILGLVDLAASALEPERGEYLALLKTSAEGLMNVLNDILDVSKLEAERMELENTGFSLVDCVESSVVTFLAPARTKGLQLACRIGDSVPRRVVGDPVRLRQVLLNLIGNAVKFTERGSIQVQVEAVEGSGPLVVQFAVRDTGIGISLEQQKSVFEPFRQADNSTTRKYGGTGLGLCISAELVRLMGGEIRLKSQPGRGSTFSFQVELGAANAGSGEVAPEPPAEPAPCRPLSILLAEDNNVNQLLAVRLLEKHGHRVEVAADGAAALAAIERARFDLVLMDVQMPVMDGIETTRAIRAREKVSGGHVPIIALTAHAMAGDEERFRNCGMDGYVSKPVRPDELFRSIAAAASVGGAFPL
jgi:PAS domain S-box-containing protein